MPPRKQTPLEIITLAKDLGINVKTDPFTEIIEFCEKKLLRILFPRQFFQCRCLPHTPQ